MKADDQGFQSAVVSSLGLTYDSRSDDVFETRSLQNPRVILSHLCSCGTDVVSKIAALVCSPTFKCLIVLQACCTEDWVAKFSSRRPYVQKINK